MCYYCHAGLHAICLSPVMLDDSLGCCCEELATTVEPSRGGPIKAPEEMRDPTSTGRKRAVLLKPISEGMQCEWAKLSRAGGGVIPIVGCAGNSATHVHHGPDKDTTNNNDENLHRVCTDCHNRWHSLNDNYYGKRPPAGTPFIPLDRPMEAHDPLSQASLEEIMASEIWWSTPIKTRKTPYVNTPKEAVNEQ